MSLVRLCGTLTKIWRKPRLERKTITRADKKVITASVAKVLTFGFIHPSSKFIFLLYVLALVMYGSLCISLGGQVVQVVMLCRVRSHLVNA